MATLYYGDNLDILRRVLKPAGSQNSRTVCSCKDRMTRGNHVTRRYASSANQSLQQGHWRAAILLPQCAEAIDGRPRHRAPTNAASLDECFKRPRRKPKATASMSLDFDRLHCARLPRRISEPDGSAEVPLAPSSVVRLLLPLHPSSAFLPVNPANFVVPNAGIDSQRFFRLSKPAS